MAKKDNTGVIFLWPEYFDLGLTRSAGRRVSKDLAVPSPNSEDIYHVCRKLGLSPDLEKEKAYPSRCFDPKGRVKVLKKYSKVETISLVAKGLSKKK